MNDYLSRVLGSKTKTASAEEAVEQVDLSKISAAEFLAGVEDGSIVIPEQEKVAEEGIDLSGLTDEQLVALAQELDGAQEKTASADEWDSVGRAIARGFLAEIYEGDAPGFDADANVRDLLEKQAGIRDLAVGAHGKVKGLGEAILDILPGKISKARRDAAGYERVAKSSLDTDAKNLNDAIPDWIPGKDRGGAMVKEHLTKGIEERAARARPDRSEVSKALAGYGTLAGATGATGLTGYAAYKALKKRRA